VIRFGGIASGFKNVNEKDQLDVDKNQLFHIHGTSVKNTKAVQVPLKAASLNSADSFVLITPKEHYIWYGKGCEEIEREFAKRIAAFLKVDQKIIIIEEGKETEKFWSELGGKTEYQNSPELQEAVREPRLFHCSNASGRYEIVEIYNFDQNDLLFDDVYLLDVYNSVMVWVGPESNHEEKLKSFEMALDYVRQASLIDGRDPDSSVIRVLAGAEPSLFTRWFHGWDDSRDGSKDAYQLALEAIKREGSEVIDVKMAIEEYKQAETTLYSYSQLMKIPGKTLPNGGKGMDLGNLEKYLTDEDFKRVFKMTKVDWEKVPLWKRTKLKQRAKLF
jgi:hypothetical protein